MFPSVKKAIFHKCRRYLYYIFALVQVKAQSVRSYKYKITNTLSVTNTSDWRRQTQSRFIRDCNFTNITLKARAVTITRRIGVGCRE